jgi:LEA14-like dessication related protein
MSFKLFSRAGGATTMIEEQRWLRDNWRHHNPDKVRVYHATLALRQLVEELKAESLERLGKLECPPSTPATIANLKAEVRFKVVEIGKEFAAAKILLEAAEVSDAFVAAVAEYEPLLKRVSELEAAEENARLDRQRREASLRDAREAAQKRALENIESDPAVLAAKEALREKVSV